MAVRPDSDLRYVPIVTLTVETGQTVTVGCAVKDGNADKECQPIAAVGDFAIGIVIALGPLAGAAGDKVQVALLTGSGIVPVKAGGTCTRGQSAKYSATGGSLQNVTQNAAGSTAVVALGWFTQSGVSGDLVGMAIGRHYATET